MDCGAETDAKSAGAAAVKCGSAGVNVQKGSAVAVGGAERSVVFYMRLRTMHAAPRSLAAHCANIGIAQIRSNT